MRARCQITSALLIGSLLAGFSFSAGMAGGDDTAPVLVVPGRAGIPVIMNGRDVSGAVIEGDWGLARPGQVTPTIIPYGGPPIIWGVPGGYYPATGKAPRYGRHEVIPPPNRPLPPPAESFYRAWTSQPGPEPATIPPPYDPPPVIVAPQINRRPWPAPRTP